MRNNRKRRPKRDPVPERRRSPNTDTGDTQVFSTPAIGDINGDGRKDVVAGSYNHKIYALDTLLGDLGQPTKGQLEGAMKGHVLAEGRLVGTYEKGR